MSKAAITILGPFIFFTLLIVAIFGFSIMAEPGHMMAGCFGITPGESCAMLSPIEHFTAHANAFQSVSTGVARAFSLLAAILLAFLVLATINGKHRNGTPKKFIFERSGNFISPQRIQFSRWLSLREKRDPSFIFAVNR